MFRSIVGTAALAAVWSMPAVAAPATPEEAQSLTTLFERYVGHFDGRPSVTVTPHGEAYTVRLDITRILSALGPLGMDVTTGDFVAELQQQGDGRWQVNVNGLPPVGINADGQATSITWNGYAFDGVFDPALEAFATATTTTGGSTSHAVGKQGMSEAALIDTGTSTLTSVAGHTPGTVDVNSRSAVKDVDYRLTVTPADKGTGPKLAPQEVRVAISSLTSNLALTDEPSRAIDELWQFLVAHPSQGALVAAQDELKTRLKAVVPLASTVVGDVAVAKVKAQTSLGTFGLDSFAEHYTFGVGSDAVATTLAMAGPSLPDGLVPPWAMNLVPTSLDLSQTYGPLHLTPVLNTLIDDLDLAAPKPLSDDKKAALMATLAGDSFAIRFTSSHIVTPTIALTIDGEARMTKPLPSGAATIAATGLDKAIAAIRASGAGDPMAEQAIVLLMAAKGVGKAEGPDSYSWRIEAPAGGQMTVNGNALGAMGGPAGTGGPATGTPHGKARKPVPATP